MLLFKRRSRRATPRPETLCLGVTDPLFDELYGIFLGAQTEISMAALDEWNGGYLAALRNALSMLNARAAAGATPVDIRFLVGETNNVEAYLGSLTRDIQNDPHISVAVATYGGAPLSWNHSKIIEVDGSELVEGGHLWLAD